LKIWVLSICADEIKKESKGMERGCFALFLFGSFFLKSYERGYLAVRVDWDLRIVARERESGGCQRSRCSLPMIMNIPLFSPLDNSFVSLDIFIFFLCFL